MPDEKHIIQIRIRDLRRARSLTQEELAEALGISRQSINAMEAGRCLPSLPVALQIASYFAVPLNTVFSIGEAIEEARQLAELQLPSNSPLRDMRELLDDMLDNTSNRETLSFSLPATNLSQTEKELHVQLLLPGYQKDDLTIEVGENFLTVSGQTHPEVEEADQQLVQREFSTQNFSRTIALPAAVQTAGAHAEMKNGILHVTLQKVTAEKPRTIRIEIQSE